MARRTFMAQVVTPYKDSTLAEVRDLITSGAAQLDATKRYVVHICSNDHYGNERRLAELSSLEKAKADALAGSPHVRYSLKPSFLRPPAKEDPSSPSLTNNTRRRTDL